MKFNFKIQQYQTDAVEAVCNAFAGQGYNSGVGYRRDLGKQKRLENTQISLNMEDEFGEELDLTNDSGFKNEEIYLSDDLLLKNIHDLQNINNITLSSALVKDLGRACSKSWIRLSSCKQGKIVGEVPTIFSFVSFSQAFSSYCRVICIMSCGE